MRYMENGPDRIRTCDLRFRRPTLYPAELRAWRPVERRTVAESRAGAPGQPSAAAPAYVPSDQRLPSRSVAVISREP